MALRVYSFRLDEELVGRIDDLSVKRSDFVRDALEVALDGEKNSIVASGDGELWSGLGRCQLSETPAEAPPVYPPHRSDGVGFSDDELTVLAVVRSGRFSVDDVSGQVGLFGISYSEVSVGLLGRDVISVEGGVVVAHE
jgi:Arc/MetJ-type ribon-helix-helix transcriptional regulator